MNLLFCLIFNDFDMNTGKYVFSQLIEFLPQRIFDSIVMKYTGNKYVKHFTCWNQLLVMIFGQLSHRDSLRDLIISIEAHRNKNYHLGFGKNITRSNLSKANEKRCCKIFEDFAYYMIAQARKKRYCSSFEIKGKIYAFDSTTIDLCLNVFWWAKFRKAKAGIKLHTLYDITTQIPAFIHITEASIHDVNSMDLIPYEYGAYYVFDRGYVDYKRLFNITIHSAYFVVRAKNNLQFKTLQTREINVETGIISDNIGTLSGFYTSRDYPVQIRKVEYYDKLTNRIFVYLTNNMDLSAEQIALLYKNRWQVELFFKWIKQHLKVKSFWGTSENAVKIQIYCAIVTYCLVAIIEHDLSINRSIYEILQVLSISLLDKTSLYELLYIADNYVVKERDFGQLALNFF